MDRANAAEWLLRGVLEQTKAAALVGDQLESRPHAGLLSFWASIFWLLILFSRRNIFGFFAFFVGALFSVFPYEFLRRDIAGYGFSQPGSVFTASLQLSGICMLLWGTVALSLVRFGVRNLLTGISCFAALLGTAVTCCFWLPYGRVGSMVAVAFFVSCGATYSPSRPAMGTLLCSVGAAWSAAYLLALISTDPHSVWGLWQGLMVLFLVPLLESIIPGRMYSSSLRKTA